MEHNSDFRYDLKVGQKAENELAEILKGSKIEVKSDYLTELTGNVFVEYMSRGKKSGISTSEAEWYCFAIKGQYVLIKSSKLKTLCRKYLNTNRDVKGGDKNTSRGILLPVKEMIDEA